MAKSSKIELLSVMMIKIIFQIELYIEAYSDIVVVESGAKYSPGSHGPLEKMVWHSVAFQSRRVRGGQRHSAAPERPGVSSMPGGQG